MSIRDDAIQHYQAQVPGLRAGFERSHRALRKQCEVEERLFTHHYIDALFDLADSEVRKRTGLAAESLSSAIEAGWRPSSDEIEAAYLDCFAWNEASGNSVSDVVAIIQQAVGNLGRPPDLELTDRFEKHVSRLQAETAQQHKAKLRLESQRALSDPGSSPSIANHYHGAVGAVQIGNENVSHVEQMGGSFIRNQAMAINGQRSLVRLRLFHVWQLVDEASGILIEYHPAKIEEYVRLAEETFWNPENLGAFSQTEQTRIVELISTVRRDNRMAASEMDAKHARRVVVECFLTSLSALHSVFESVFSDTETTDKIAYRIERANLIIATLDR